MRIDFQADCILLPDYSRELLRGEEDDPAEIRQFCLWVIKINRTRITPVRRGGIDTLINADKK